MIQDKRIHQLIAKQLLEGVDEKERRELEEWLKEPENRILYEKMTEKSHVRSRIQKWASIDVEKYANAFGKEIDMKHDRRIGKWCAYAAAVAALVAVGIVFWVLTVKDAGEPCLADAAIVPGQAKAVLVLDDGRQVELDTRSMNEIVEKDGKIIMNDSAGINYNREVGEQGTGLTNKVIVPTGGEYNLILSDGTTVYLNAESKIEFPVKFSGKERVVTLEGEAYFQVAASKKHPFIVKTKDMDVLVTGTEFNVKAYAGNQVDVTLVEGKVAVKQAGDGSEYPLAPGENAHFAEGMAPLIEKVNVHKYIAWKEGYFYYENERMEVIVNDLKRWYDFDVVYVGSGVKDLRFELWSGRDSDIDTIMGLLTKTNKVNVRLDGRTLIVSERNK